MRRNSYLSLHCMKNRKVIIEHFNKIEKNYLEAVDNAFGFEVAKKLTEFKTIPEGFRTAGSVAESEAADWIASEMRRIGLAEVQKENIAVDGWEFLGAELTVQYEDGETEVMHAGSFPGLYGTKDEGIEAQLVYVGEGTANCYEGKDVNGKIVLIDTDAYYSHWYDVLFTQAQERGAVAVVAAVTDRGPGTYCDNLITIQNIQGLVDIPAVMMSRGDSEKLRETISDGDELIVTLRTDIKISADTQAHFVHGRIEGKHKDSYIIYSGHYDAYWDGFLDNASSIGSMLTIAKAMIESGFEPDSTIIFVANGAEEFGRMGSARDFCIGSTDIVRKHPEWIKGTKLCVNFELSAFNEMGCFALTVTAAYASWFKEILDALQTDTEHMIVPTSLSGADNIVFAKAGIPTCMNIAVCFGTEKAKSESGFDHTQYDNIDRYDEKAFSTSNMVYGLLGIIIDQQPLLPFDFSAYVKDIEKAPIDEIAEMDADRCKEYAQLIRSFADKAKLLRERCMMSTSVDLCAINRKLLGINRLFMYDVYKYNAMTELIVGHDQPYAYVRAIDNFLGDLKKGTTESLDTIETLDYNYLISEFDKEVYEKTAIQAFDDSVPQEWTEGHTLPFPDLYDVITAIREKAIANAADYTAETEILKTIRAEQIQILTETIENEIKSIRHAINLADDVLQELK